VVTTFNKSNLKTFFLQNFSALGALDINLVSYAIPFTRSQHEIVGFELLDFELWVNISHRDCK